MGADDVQKVLRKHGLSPFSRGTVRAVIGQNLRPGNVWETAELPALLKNPKVDKIVTIDPVIRLEKTIFVRGDL